MLANKENSDSKESDDTFESQSDIMVHLGNEVTHELNKYLLSPLTNIVNQYSCFRLNLYDINEYFSTYSIKEEFTNNDEFINMLLPVDSMVTKLVLINTTECEGVETTRKINIYPDIKTNVITFEQIHGGLHKFFKEWKSYFHHFFGTAPAVSGQKSGSNYDRYNQEGNENAFLHGDEAIVNGTVMIIPITLTGIYNLK